MNSFAYKVAPRAIVVHCTDDDLVVSLNDGRVLSVPLVWFPRLVHASSEQLGEFEFLGEGEGIHWPAIDEHHSIAGPLEGRPSVEYQPSQI